jgi:hypothetical protein
LAGDIALGGLYPREFKDIVLCQSHPKLFIYNTVNAGPATVFGTYPGKQDNEDSFYPFLDPRIDEVPGSHMYFSSASLKDVTRMQVVKDEKSDFCRAIIFIYGNGAQRAVGNCRLGIDLVKTYLNPSRICYLPVSLSHVNGAGPRQVVRVEGENDSTHRHEENGWICSPMEGNLEFWFSAQDFVSTIVIENEN